MGKKQKLAVIVLGTGTAIFVGFGVEVIVLEEWKVWQIWSLAVLFGIATLITWMAPARWFERGAATRSPSMASGGKKSVATARRKMLDWLPGIRGRLAARKAKRFAEHPSITFNEMFTMARGSSAVRFGLPHENPGMDEVVANIKARDELARALCDRFVKEHPDSCQRVGPIHTEEPYSFTPATIIVLTGDFQSFLAAESAKALARRDRGGKAGDDG